MTAICGLTRPSCPANLRAMLATLPGDGKHPDEWTDGTVALGGKHALVRKTRSSPSCVAFDGHSSLALVADVRLDDRRSLCDALGVPHPERQQVADAALVLGAYVRWRRDCADHLLGDYAFAVWDANERSLFCARDHAGARPFYYAHTPAGFAFASTVAGVLAAPGVNDDLDELSVAEHLTSIGLLSTTRTFFKAVAKLPPGHTLTVDCSGDACRAAAPMRYWRPEHAPRLPPTTDDQYAEEFLAHYEQAVADRLRGPDPISVHMSGGLDSSSVAALAARQLRRQGRPPPLAFSWLPDLAGRPPKPEHAKEYALIDAACAKAGLQVAHCAIGKDDTTALLRRDCAFPGAMLGSEDLVQRTAAAQGARVLLTGLGGDEGASFNGRGRLESMLLRGRWRHLTRACRASGTGPRRLLLDHVLPLISPPLMLELRRLRRGKPLRARRGFADSSFRRRLRPRPEPVPRYLDVRRTQLALLQFGHLSARIEDWAASGARRGIEYRFPLLDRRVIEFVLGLPPEQFMRGPTSRLLMRRALRTVLPAEVCGNTSKAEPARADPLLDVHVAALPAIGQELAARTTPPARARYVDVERLLAHLSAAHIRTGRQNVQIYNALAFLDWQAP